MSLSAIELRIQCYDDQTLCMPHIQSGYSLRDIERVVTASEASQAVVGDLALVTYWAVDPAAGLMHCTSVLRKSNQNALGWVAVHSQYSNAQPLSSS